MLCIFVPTKQTNDIMTNLVRTTIQISDLQIGMTVEHEGVLCTVGKESISRTHHGIAFNGDASKKTITMIQFAVQTAKGIVLR